MNFTFTLRIFLLLLAAGGMRCKKADVVTPLDGTPVAGTVNVTASWIFDKAHSNLRWETDYYDYSNAKLVGRFNNFNFSPKFVFDEANLSSCVIHAWVQLSTFDSGEPGRDGPGKCGRSFLGVTYLDSAKTVVDPLSDTAWFRSTSVTKSGTGYAVKGNFTLNRYRTPSGFADGTPITKEVTMYLKSEGMKDFDTNGDGIPDRLRASFTGNFTFNRSDFMDTKAAIQWVPYVFHPADSIGNISAANNKTYGAWSKNVADEMSITMNMQFYKDH